MGTTKYPECQTESRYPTRHQRSLNIVFEGCGPLALLGPTDLGTSLDAGICAAFTSWWDKRTSI